MNASNFDHLIYVAQSESVVTNLDSINILMLIIKELEVIEIQGDEEFRSFWFEVPRGNIEDFGNYEEYLEEEEVSNYEEFVNIWKDYYPEETKWYEFAVKNYNNVYYFFIDSKLTLQVNLTEERTKKEYYSSIFIELLQEIVLSTLNNIKADVVGYNDHVNSSLSFDRRFGRMLRNDYWSIFQEENLAFRNHLSNEDFYVLESIVNQTLESGLNLTLNKLTAGDFFNYCRMGYVANDYFKGDNKILSVNEMYKIMADGRDEGLTDLQLDSEADFLDWFKQKSGLGHPWEICSGGNSTHISLYVHLSENGWQLILDGSSFSRVLETVKMAIALYKNNVPFTLNKSVEILRMITGVDYIGIVPKTIIPRYCHSHFEKEDMIIDFMNLGYDKTEEIIQKATWFQPQEVRLTL